MMDFNGLKLPPHSDEAELALLGAMIESNRLINDIDYIRADEFYRIENRVIFNRLQALAFVGKPVDAVTLVDALESAGELPQAGGVDYVVELVTQSRGPHNAHSYAGIVKDKALNRNLVQIGYKITEMGYEDGDAKPKIDAAQGLVMDIETTIESEPEQINSILRDAVAEIDRRFRASDPMIGIASGFTELDKMTAGFQAGQLILIAGRPGSGKTTLSMSMVEHAAMNGKFCLVFNLEMTKRTLMMKSISSLGKIPYKLLRAGQLDDYWPQLTATASKLRDKAIYVDDNSQLTSIQIMSKARKVAQKVGRKIDLIVLDYLQLLSDKGEGHERITRISRAIKIAAKELDCPIIALSQLSRALDSRGDKRPILSDLRESGSLEQDADTVIMVYREEAYNKDTTEKGIAEIIVRKQREGETGTVYLAANLGISRFDNLAYEYQPPAERQDYGSKRRGRGYDD